MGGFNEILFNEDLLGFESDVPEEVGPVLPEAPAGRLIVEIAGVSRFIVPNSLKIEEDSRGRSTCEVTIQNWISGTTPIVGKTIKVKWNSEIVFFGTIDEVEYENPNGTTLINWKLKCVDWNQLADRFTVTSSFDTATFQEIVVDLLVNYLGAEGVTAGIIPTGPTFARVVYPGMQVSECFNELTTLTGYNWNINHQKQLDFCPPGTLVAPISIEYANGIYRDPLFRRTRAQFADSVTILGGRDTSAVQTETFTGDGVNRNFTVALKIAKKPTITLNSNPQTVGIKGLETGFDFYWSLDDAVVKQDNGGAVLADTDVLEIDYQGFFPILLQLDSVAAIAERRSVEGGSGRYEIVEKDDSIDSNLLALDRGSGILRRQAVIPTEFSFQTDTLVSSDSAAMRAGQTISVDFTSLFGISGTFFIQNLSINDKNGQYLQINAKTIDSEKAESWSDYFAKLFAAGKRTVLRGGEQLIATRSFTGEQIIFADSIGESHGAPDSLIGSALVGFSEVTL